MKEEEIRPQAIFDEYLRLAAEDTVSYFAKATRQHGACPACNVDGEFAFSKLGFDYASCGACGTLFVNPRPVAEAFARYYTESPSSKYWASTFYRETAAARREKLWKPKARAVQEIVTRYVDSSPALIVDIGGGYGLFAEEIEALMGRAPLVIEPGPQLAAACREKGIAVIEKFLEEVQKKDLPPGAKAFVSFELFEHLHDPAIFLRHLHGLMSVGDLFVFTTLSGTGIDIQVLWAGSKSVTPPHHLNFLNPNAVRILLARCGFEVLEVTTPGKLDIDILSNNRNDIKDRFWRTFVDTASELEKREWQNMIAASGWSSHMMAVCRKP